MQSLTTRAQPTDERSGRVKVLHRTTGEPEIEFDAELRVEVSLLQDQKTVASLPDDRPMGLFVRVSP